MIRFSTILKVHPYQYSLDEIYIFYVPLHVMRSHSFMPHVGYGICGPSYGFIGYGSLFLLSVGPIDFTNQMLHAV